MGNTVDPVIHYYSNSSKTITVTIYDVNGNSISSTQFNVNSGLNNIQLGDWLSSIQNLQEGYYILDINGNYVTIVVSQGSINVPNPVNKVKKIIIYDKVTGLYLEIPRDAPLVPYGSNRFMTFIYYHDDDKRLGKLHIIDGSNEIETDWARRAIISITVGFSSIDDMYSYISRYIDDSDSNVASVIGRIANSSKEDAVKIASMYHLITPIGDLINWKLDIENKEITMDIVVRLGWGWRKVWDVIKYAIAGALVGASVAASIGITVGTYGTGILVAGAVSGALFGIAFKMVGSDNGKDWQEKLKSDRDQGVDNVTKAYSDAMNTLDYYYQRGEISDDAYNALKQKITTIKDVAIQSINEIYEDSKKCYQAGYNDAKSKYIKYTIVAGVGGLFIGTMLSRR